MHFQLFFLPLCILGTLAIVLYLPSRFVYYVLTVYIAREALAFPANVILDNKLKRDDSDSGLTHEEKVEGLFNGAAFNMSKDEEDPVLAKAKELDLCHTAHMNKDTWKELDMDGWIKQL